MGIPAIRKDWKRIAPTSLRQALELCKDYAKEKRNLSVERIAERMGVTDHWSLYKWLQSGRMPANLIPVYEAVCGVDYVTRWLAATNGRLLIAIPTGRAVTAEDMQALQELLHTTVGALMQFYAGKAEAQEAISSIQHAMEGLAWHHGNVTKHLQPELELEGSDDE